jgi:hypothetical protein
MSPRVQFVDEEVPAMNFLCSGCGKCQSNASGWRLVIELDKPGTEIRNTFFLVGDWDEKKAADPNAYSFCSAGCEEQYLAVRHRQLVA